MKNKYYKIAAIILASMLGVFVLFLAQDVSNSAASPMAFPATTTPNPTEIPDADWYWSHEVVNLTKSHPGSIGTFYSDTVTAPEVDPDDVEAVVFHIIKNCPTGNSHWAKGDWASPSGGSWATYKQVQTCDTSYLDWWYQTGTQNYADTKAEITTRFGSIGDTAISNTQTDDTTDFRAVTSAGTTGDGGYTSVINVYYLHHGIDGACSDDVEISSEPFAEGTIDATLEEGITEPLADGGNYVIEITGGPWDDGLTDTRTDAAYSWDGIDWEILSSATDEIGCVEDLETGGQRFFVEAQSSTLSLRVNDEADEFDDNADDLDYALYGVVGSGETGCGGNYTLGTMVFDEEWDATMDDWQGGGKDYPALVDDDAVYFENNDIYRILIPHTYGDGIQYNAEAQIQPLLGGNWISLGSHPNTVCIEDHDDDYADAEGWIAYYFMSPEDFTTYKIRPNDLDGINDANYDNNSGGFHVSVFSATYNPPVAGCAAQFDQGPLIQTIRVDSFAENGIRIPDPLYAYMRDDEGGLLAGTAYMIEEPASWAGFTPAGTGSNYFGWQISADRSTWYNIEDFAGCISPIDTQHNKYFFDAASSEYYIRAKDYDGDGSWTDQPGWISLNLYYADDLRTSPDANGDCPNLVLGDSLYSGSVGSTELEGGFLPNIFTAGQLYGIQLTTPPWTDDSVDQKAAQIKLAGADDWAEFEDWEGAFCSETDGNDWPLNWIQALDSRYLLRADDSIGDNAGFVNYTIYDAGWITDPIYASCEGDYSPITFADFPVLDQEIPAQWADGQLVQDFYLRQGTYKLTTDDGPWSDMVLLEMPILSYDLEISLYNGQLNSWQALDVAADCIVELSDGNHVRAYFSIDEGYDSFVRVRVANQDALGFIDNTGSMTMSWQYSSVGIDPNDEWDPYDDPGGLFQSGGCDLICVVPPSILNIPAWLEYFRCQLVVRLSFCPYHIEVISAMADLFYQREPFGSMQEMGQSFGLVRGNVDQYQWSEDQGGDPPDVGYPDNFLFASPDGGGANIPLVGDDTIWGSGEIELLDYSQGEYDQTCTNNLAASLGSRLSAPICFAFNVLEGLGLSSWFQFFWDISMLIALSMYFQNRWLKPMTS